MELIQGGRDMEVTASNVYDYVRKYAEYRMYKAQQKALDVSIKLFINLIVITRQRFYFFY